MLELIGGALSAILSGGATGLIGVAIQRFADYKNKMADLEKMKIQHEHERGLRELDAKIMEQEWAGRTKVAAVEAAGAEAVADAQAFAASFQLEPKRYSEGVKPGRVAGFLLVLLDVLRGVVRPGLTLYLCWIATVMYEQSRALIAIGDLQPVLLLDTHKQLVSTLLYLFTTCVLWWFGTRNKAPQPKSAG
jgi:hypothetical protein